MAGQILNGPTSVRDAIEFAVRPEDVALADNGFELLVKVVEPLGAHVLVTGTLDGALFRAVLDSATEVAPGDRLKLKPHPDRIRWFDPETTAALKAA